MEEFWILISVAFFAINLLDKTESVKVKLEETPLKTFDEIFGEGWWDKGEAEDLKRLTPTNFGQNVHHQIDRQNTQIGQIEPNSTDQNPPLTESDHFGQIEPNSTDQSENIAEDERKLKIIEKFHAIKEELKQKGKFPCKERVTIEKEIAKHLKASRSKIYKWKKEFGQIVNQKELYEKEKRKHLVEKFDQMKAELTRDGFKNSYKEINENVAKKFGITDRTIYNWKRKLGQTKPTHKHPNSEQKELMKLYYEIKQKNPKMSDKKIAKLLKIGTSTLFRWKRQFKRQQFQPNSVDGHSVEENAAANVQEIGNLNSGRI